MAEMVRRGTPYQGVLFVGLMIEDGQPRLVEYNVRFANLEAGRLRHRDHRFEWTRAEFAEWCERIAVRHEAAHERLEIPAYVRIGVLAQHQRGARVMDEDLAEPRRHAGCAPRGRRRRRVRPPGAETTRYWS